MAKRAEFYVKNVSKGNNAFKVIRYEPDGKPGFEAKISKGKEERIPLQSLETGIIINAPKGKDTKYYPIRIKADVAFTMKYSRFQPNWTIKIDANDDPPSVPTTVNVEIGDDEPDITGEG